ncbi:lytic transglycosylase domain-containing protein [Sphingomonas sp. G124]|uniref:Lytic transglycosylase domain-containing protein n=1 Tax=Sphingomonas cremea TaxID=2904799 RepID=A0A9X1QIS7_9SPHN|nr:lytic transglycosylase domain-containing protein [Sphingomonas cremea]MCF2514170.1 lytic transglycosylase domain-containing protein [Sphingomonas cremea]
MRLNLIFCASVALASPALAQDADPLAPLEPSATAEQPSAPAPQANTTQPLQPLTPPPPPKVIPKDWRGVFAAIGQGDWEGARLGIDGLPDDPLKPYAKAELFTAKGSPKVELGPLLAVVTEAPELPQAAQLQRMLVARGAVEPPAIYWPRPTVSLGSAPRRGKTRPVEGEPVADELRLAFEPYVKVDDGPGAEALYLQAYPNLSYEARAEAANRVAWIYYVGGRDADARRIADQGRLGATGDWAAQAAWISGLAAWRMADWNAAYGAFREAASRAREPEFNAAAYYWTARAAQASRRPKEVAPLLRAAARSQESFYGLMAREVLGMDKRLPKTAAPRDLSRVEALPNIRRATEFVAIGMRSSAEELLRHQSKIGSPADQRSLIRIADKLGLPGAQFWLAHFGQPGAQVDAADRYPIPNWTPYNGWRVDPALAYAHIIQESNFRSDAVSPAGAVGLMQVRPGTAGDTARSRGTSVSAAALKDPLTNIDYGQAFIELIRGSSATRGQLPKVIAAYNAGPVPVERWAYYDRGDPLLWIESIPYWETRFYVPSVLRNMWVIQGLEGAETPTLTALVQHKWPDFPQRRR